MTETMTRRALAGALALGVLLATDLEAQATADATTGTTTASAPAEERYHLVEVGGKKLPVEVEKEWRCHESVTRGTLTLRDDGRWHLQTTIREQCGSRAEVETDDEEGRYTREGGTITFHDDDDDDGDWDLRRDLDLDDLKTATAGGDGALTVQLADGETALLFRR